MTLAEPKTRAPKRRKMTRLVVLLILALLACYTIIIEPRNIEMTTVSVYMDTLPAGMAPVRIVHLTDFHYRLGFSDTHFRRIVQRVNALQPDLIVLTGDYTSMPQKQNIAPCARMLEGLRARYGVWAVLGNHDRYHYSEATTRALTKHGIRVLNNEAAPITTPTGRFWLLGVDDYWHGHADLPTALCKVPANEGKVLLVHEPDFADVAATHGIDLQLSGHSHGGMVRVLHFERLVLPPYARNYPLGAKSVQDMLLYTNRGIGVPIRFNCRPEIALITLYPLPRVLDRPGRN